MANYSIIIMPSRTPKKLKPNLSLEQYKKEFVREMDNLDSLLGIGRQVFSDFLELAAISVHQVPYLLQEVEPDQTFQQLEDKYKELSNNHRPETIACFSRLLAITMLALAEFQCDFLGPLYMEYGNPSQRLGQYFTPDPICRMMARMSLNNFESVVKERGIVTLDEPACGAGGMIISVAQEIEYQGYDPRVHLQIQATDIGRDCFNMCYIQLSLLSLQAIVRHGNTLTQEIWETRTTPQLRIFNKWKSERLQELEKDPCFQMIRFMRQLEQEFVQSENKIVASSISTETNGLVNGSNLQNQTVEPTDNDLIRINEKDQLSLF